MRLIVQRVLNASVEVDGEVTGEIDRGLMVLLGITHTDTMEAAMWAADKLGLLRIFSDSQGRMNLSLKEVGASLLVVSQFTLFGEVRRGLRPDFRKAAPGDMAEPLYEAFVDRLRARGHRVETGVFGAHMQVQLVNDGPVTLIIDTDEVMPSGVRRISNGSGNS